MVDKSGQPAGRSADIFSLGCVFIEMLTVLANRSIDEFKARITKDIYQEEMGIRDWLCDELPSNLPEGTQGFVACALHMVNTTQSSRPLAATVWEITQCTRTEDNSSLCGTCCQTEIGLTYRLTDFDQTQQFLDGRLN